MRQNLSNSDININNYVSKNNESNLFSKFIKKENCEFNENEGYTSINNLVEFDYLFVSLAVGSFCISSKLYIKYFYLFNKLIFFFTLPKLNKLKIKTSLINKSI